MPMKFAPIPALTESQERNFWAKVLPTGFCWEWAARTTRDGYGLFNIDRTGHTRMAHRIAYSLLMGEIQEDLELDHLCRNRACVNPDHLDPVTRRVNRNRIPFTNYPNGGQPPWVVSGKNITGFCKHGHEYTPDNTYTYPDGRTECRRCKSRNRRKARS